MKPPQRAWAAGVIGVLFVAILVLKHPQPRLYHGKSVHDWVTLLDPDVNKSQQRDEASWAVVKIGTEALPELERILAWRHNRLIERIQGYAIHLGIMKLPTVSHFQLQSRACEAAFHLAERAGTDISQLVPHLHYHFMNGTYADWSSGRALAGAGTIGVAVLTNLVITGARNVRDNAGPALRYANKRPEVIVALLQAIETEPDRQLRANLLLYLRGSGAPAEQVVPVGLRFLQSDDAYTRRMAATLLRDYRTDENVQRALEAAGR